MVPSGFVNIAHRGASAYAPENTFSACIISVARFSSKTRLDLAQEPRTQLNPRYSLTPFMVRSGAEGEVAISNAEAIQAYPEHPFSHLPSNGRTNRLLHR